MRTVPRNELGFICLSGLAIRCQLAVLLQRAAVCPASLVAPIDKLSILVTVLFSYLVFHEKLSKKHWPVWPFWWRARWLCCCKGAVCQEKNLSQATPFV